MGMGIEVPGFQQMGRRMQLRIIGGELRDPFFMQVPNGAAKN